MNEEKTMTLSEAATNIIENLACRIAEQVGGGITPNHLMPYLPMSWELIKSCLDEMVDDSSVFTRQVDNIVTYEFTVYKSAACKEKFRGSSSCLSCGNDMAHRGGEVLCSECFKILKRELTLLAERIGWPAQAVYEHEILYLASRQDQPVHAETLAGRSRYTLRRMRQKLNTMILNGAIRQEVDEQTGVIVYYFPRIEYPTARFRQNMSLIQTYPSSVMEELQIKMVKILVSLGCLLLVLVALAFLHFPFPVLVLIFLVASPLISLAIWQHKKRPGE